MGLKVIKQDLDEGLPFPKNFFDYVIAGEIIEHLPNVSNVIKEIHRVLKDTGILIGSVPNPYTISKLLSHFFLNPVEKVGGHLYLFDKKHILYLLEQNGFKEVKFYPDAAFPIWKPLSFINKALGKILPSLSYCIIFQAKKNVRLQ